MKPDAPVLTEIRGRTAVVTLNRPRSRNAVNGPLLVALRRAMVELDDSQQVDAIVLTGTDPAFCAGLDLVALTEGDPELDRLPGAPSHSPWPRTRTPVIGAVNGPAVTGGLEVALHCDFLVASERATFADTHARVGVLPCWGLTAQLPAAVGVRNAAWMSLTGTPLNAREAMSAGLVSHVVAHEDLLRSALAAADRVSANAPGATPALLASYREAERVTRAEAFAVETRASARWHEQSGGAAAVAERRTAIIGQGGTAHAESRQGL